MAAKKDFSAINTENMYSNITEATAAPGQRKPRKVPTPEEAAAARQTGKTQGLKGTALPRFNMAFWEDNYDYIVCMSRACNQSYTQFVNRIIAAHKAAHLGAYQKALAFAAEMDKEL